MGVGKWHKLSGLGSSPWRLGDQGKGINALTRVLEVGKGGRKIFKYNRT